MTALTIRRFVAVSVCAAQAAACASSPDSIEARYVSPNVYQNWTCEQLVEERTRLTREVQRVSGLQRENANADAAMMTVGVIIFWPMLFGLAATKDRKDELGRLKGEYDAVDLSIRTRPCTVPPPAGVPGIGAGGSVPAVPAAPAGETAVQADGVWRGKGRTDSWCQPPTLGLTLRGNRIEGTLSEVASGATTSTVTGVLDPAGVASLDFKATGADYFGGRVDGALANGVLSVAFRSRTARACSYAFELRRTAAAE